MLLEVCHLSLMFVCFRSLDNKKNKINLLHNMNCELADGKSGFILVLDWNSADIRENTKGEKKVEIILIPRD